MSFRKVAIIGLGLLGGSIGLAVRQHLPGQGLPHALRITIGTRAQMDEVAATLRALADGAR